MGAGVAARADITEEAEGGAAFVVGCAPGGSDAGAVDAAGGGAAEGAAGTGVRSVATPCLGFGAGARLFGTAGAAAFGVGDGAPAFGGVGASNKPEARSAHAIT
jgi:hypothetical protein